jgi:hypothetical protein
MQGAGPGTASPSARAAVHGQFGLRSRSWAGMTAEAVSQVG